MNRFFSSRVIDYLLEICQALEMILSLRQLLLFLVLSCLSFDIVVDWEPQTLVVVVERRDFWTIIIWNSSEKLPSWDSTELPILFRLYFTADQLTFLLPFAILQYFKLNLRADLFLFLPFSILVVAYGYIFWGPSDAWCHLLHWNIQFLWFFDGFVSGRSIGVFEWSKMNWFMMFQHFFLVCWRLL